jgi:lysophospholipase L1-like esterase
MLPQNNRTSISNQTGKTYVVVVWGNSIPAGNGDLARSWPMRAETIFNVAVNTGRSIKVYNEGVCGMSAARGCQEFETRVQKHHPDLSIIQFGFNDLRYDGSRGNLPLSTLEEFEKHLERMVCDCREQANTKVVLFGNHRSRSFLEMPTGLSYDATRIRYNQVASAVAEKMKVQYIDMSEALTPIESWKDYICEDSVHLSQIGTSAYACVTVNVIRKTMLAY